MFPYALGNCPPGNLSGNERYHAALAYTRSRGNEDPDKDGDWDAKVTAPGGRISGIQIVN